MRSLRRRVIEPEWLEEAPVEAARRNLAELTALNRYLGGHRILCDRLRQLVSPAEQFSFLDIGAASGDMARMAQRTFPGLRVFNLDRQARHLERASGPCLVGDGFRLPFRDRSLDVTHCSLLLHHFADDAVVQLLAEMWRVARRGVIAQDLERRRLPYYFLPATRWLFNWSELVLHDGPISVAAGFRRAEFKQLAELAGMPEAQVRVHRPAFRLSLLAVRR